MLFSAMQVSDAISDKPQDTGCGHTAGLQLCTSGREVIPALGLAWANCVNTRLFLSRLGHVPWPNFLSHARPQAAPASSYSGEDEQHGLLLRSLQVVFSPHLPQAGALYVVLQSGVVGVPHPSTWASCEPVSGAEMNPSTVTAQRQREAADQRTANVLQNHQPAIAGHEQACLQSHLRPVKHARLAHDAGKENSGAYQATRVATGVFA